MHHTYRNPIKAVSLQALFGSNNILREVQIVKREVNRRLKLLLPSTLIRKSTEMRKFGSSKHCPNKGDCQSPGRQQHRPFQVHQDNGWDFPDLQLLSGISVGLAVSTEHLVVVGQPLFLGEKSQTILPRHKTFQSQLQILHLLRFGAKSGLKLRRTCM